MRVCLPGDCKRHALHSRSRNDVGVGHQSALIQERNRKGGTGNPIPPLRRFSYSVVLVTSVTISVTIHETLPEILRIDFAAT